MRVKWLIGGILWLAVLAGLVELGAWQVRRLAWKQQILAEIEARIAADPAPLPARPDPERDRFLPVRLSGQMQPEALLVLVSTRERGPGYRVISPFVTQDGRKVLVDRGFIPTEARDRTFAAGPMQVVGNLHWPDERDRFTPEDDIAGNTWFARDVNKMARVLGTEPVLVVARTPTDPAIQPLPVTTEGIPNNHLQYAVTWFAFAAIWVVMTAVALWRIRRPRQAGQTAPAQENS